MTLSRAIGPETHALPESSNPFNRRVENDRTGVKHECKSDIRKKNFVLDRKIPSNMVAEHCTLLRDGVRVSKQHNIAMLGRVRNQLVGFGLVGNISSQRRLRRISRNLPLQAETEPSMRRKSSDGQRNRFQHTA